MLCNKVQQQVFGPISVAVNIAMMHKVLIPTQPIHAFKVVTTLKLVAVGA